MANHSTRSAVDAKAVAHVVELETAEGRQAITLPESTTVGVVSSPPRLIEVLAFEGAADSLELEAEQIDAALSDANFWLYVVEHAAGEPADMVVTRLGGEDLRALMATRVEYRWAEIAWPHGEGAQDAEATVAHDDAELEATEDAEAPAAAEHDGDVPASDHTEHPEHIEQAGQNAHDDQFAEDDSDDSDDSEHAVAAHLEEAFAMAGAAEEPAQAPKRTRWFF